jgi:tetratricopeptide (TPR) repeat protein
MGAAESAETALNLNNQMVAMDLANLTWRHDRVIALAKLGDARLAQGRLFDAARSYDNATKAAKELVAINPQRLDWLGIQAVTPEQGR